MAILVACRCGQAIEADAWLAGKVVQCPVCRNPLVVPTPTEAPPPYVPRSVPTVSRESRETTESVVTFLVAGAVIFLVVLGLSVGIVVYVRWKNPAANVPTAPDPSSSAPLIPSAPTPSGQLTRGDAAAGGTTPLAVPSGVPANTAPPAQALAAIPADWNSFDHPTARFSVILPGAPELSEERIETLVGYRTSHSLTSVQEEHVYEACREFPPYRILDTEIADAYASVAARRAEEISGSIVRSENLRVDGRLINDLVLQGTVDGVPVRQYMRLIAVRESVLQLSCRVPTGKERAADIAAFLANYKVD